jgi:predicted RNA polymerase sigma factor
MESQAIPARVRVHPSRARPPSKFFGVENLSLAGDVAQEILAKAFEVWSYGGVPEHYSALLTVAAKNRVLDVFRRERTASKFAPELQHLIESEWTLRPAVEELFLPPALKDDELRMMFSCCKSAFLGAKRASANRGVYSSSRQTTLRRASRRCTAHSTCSSARGTTARAKSPSSARICVAKRCA